MTVCCPVCRQYVRLSDLHGEDRIVSHLAPGVVPPCAGSGRTRAEAEERQPKAPRSLFDEA